MESASKAFIRISGHTYRLIKILEKKLKYVQDSSSRIYLEIPEESLEALESITEIEYIKEHSRYCCELDLQFTNELWRRYERRREIERKA